VRGYRRTLAGFELVAVTARDFEGFNMFMKELRSPIPNQLWMLAWGQAHTANGKFVRCRVYAFDGETFKTMWSPEEMFRADVRVWESGLAIDHYVRPNDIHDEYLITPNGPLKTNSYVVNQK
jgi:hypothetical protein